MTPDEHDPTPAPGGDPKPAVPPREITLEEWIASTQSCCGVEPGE